MIQAATINGRIIDKARWEIQNVSAFQEGQTMQVNVPTKDANLLHYVAKQGRADCMVERDDRSSVNLTFVVKQIRHMLEASNGGVDTMVVIVPITRPVEHVILYVMDTEKCDERFVRAVKARD